MIVKIGKSRHSFKGLAQYLTHDPNAQTTERVAWTHTYSPPGWSRSSRGCTSSDFRCRVTRPPAKLQQRRRFTLTRFSALPATQSAGQIVDERRRRMSNRHSSSSVTARSVERILQSPNAIGRATLTSTTSITNGTLSRRGSWWCREPHMSALGAAR
jgi:hypothetical protein